jgi:Fic family protein
MHKESTQLGYLVSLDDFLKQSEQEQKAFLLEMVYESNLIEGINIDPVQTRNINDALKREPELDHHYDALNYVYDNYRKPLDINEIKHTHFILMHELLKDAGQYRTKTEHVGRYGYPEAKAVPELMKDLEKRMRNIYEQKKGIEDILKSHYQFETIHPFSDGNGRTGRLALNWLTLNNLGSFIVVENEHKQSYYKEIQANRERFRKAHPQIRFSRNISEKRWKERIEKEQKEYWLEVHRQENIKKKKSW